MSVIYFAIGDVHGEAGMLADMHDAILDRIAFERRPARIIHLGDYVDRGPDSRAVIDRIMALEREYDSNPLIEVISLMGNHEDMMLGQVSRLTPAWLESGGSETLASYGADFNAAPQTWMSAVPRAHLDWLGKLPALYHDPGRKLAFVHAGIDPKTFPNCRDEVRMWTRASAFTDDPWPERDELDGLTVIHAHTPTDDDLPLVTPRRINIDTGAVYGGALTAVMLKEGDKPVFLRVEA